MVLLVYLHIKENLYLKLYLSGPKIEINAFIWEGLCAGVAYTDEGGGGGAYTRSNISGKEKVGLSAGEPIRGGEGAYRRRNTVLL